MHSAEAGGGAASAGAGGPQPSSDSAPDSASEALPTFAAAVQALLRNAWGLVQDQALLIALEAQHAGRNLIRMIFGGVVAAVLLVTAWLALVTSLMFWILESDVRWAQAFLAVGLIHVVVSLLLIAWLRRVARVALFSSVLRQLHPDPAAQSPGEGA